MDLGCEGVHPREQAKLSTAETVSTRVGGAGPVVLIVVISVKLHKVIFSGLSIGLYVLLKSIS